MLSLSAPARAETALDALLEARGILHRHGQSKAAIAAFERAAALRPEFAAPHYHLSRLYSERVDGQRDLRRAFEEGEAFLKLADPRNPADRAAMLETLGRLAYLIQYDLRPTSAAEAQAALARRIAWRQKQVELSGLDQYYEVLATAYLAAGRYDEAIAVYDTVGALDLDPTRRAMLPSQRLRALIAAGRWQRELEARQRAAAKRPNDSAAYRALADMYEALDHIRRAIQALRRAVALDPRDIELRHRLTSLYWRLGWGEQVAQECMVILDLAPADSRATDTLVLLVRSGFPVSEPLRRPNGEPGPTLAELVMRAGHPDGIAALAGHCLQAGDAELALRLARRAMERAMELGTRSLEGPRAEGILIAAYLKLGRANEIEALVDELGKRNPALVSMLVGTWARALVYDKDAWPQAARLADHPQLSSYDRAELLGSYVAKLGHESRPEAIAFLERLLASSERLDLRNIDRLYEQLITYHGYDQAHEAAVGVCRRYAQEVPSARSHYVLARTLNDASRPQEAEAAYRRAVELATDTRDRQEAMGALGRLLLASGRLAEAITQLREQCRLYPRSGACGDLMKALVAAGRKDDIRAGADEVLAEIAARDYGDYTAALYPVFDALEALDGEDQAFARFEAARAAHPDAEGLLHFLIRKYPSSGQVDRLLVMATNFPLSEDRPLKELTVSLGTAGVPGTTAAVLLEVILSNSVPISMADWVSQECVEACRVAETLDVALARAEAAHAKEPTNAGVASLLARIYTALDRRADAVRVYVDLAASHAHEREAVKCLLFAAGDDPAYAETVLPYLQREASQNIGQAYAHAKLARALASLRRDREAAAEFALAFETDDNLLRPQYALADEFAVHRRLGTTGDLIKRYRQLVADWPEDPVAHVVLAEVCGYAGRRKDAKAQLDLASGLAGRRDDVRRRISEISGRL